MLSRKRNLLQNNITTQIFCIFDTSPKRSGLFRFPRSWKSFFIQKRLFKIQDDEQSKLLHRRRITET
jgi:hypothetical protein